MKLLGLLVGALPASRTKNRLMSWIPGWRVAPDASVAPSVFWGVRSLEIGPRARIGSGNAFRTLRSVSLGEAAEIGQLNWFSAAARFAGPLGRDLAGKLEMSGSAAITSRHYVDCSGGVALGRRGILGGVRGTILSHGVDPWTLTMEAQPVRIGDLTLVNTNVVITPGVTICSRCVVGAGAVVVRDLLEEETLYGGIPAKAIGSLHGAAVFDLQDARLIPRGSGESAANAQLADHGPGVERQRRIRGASPGD